MASPTPQQLIQPYAPKSDQTFTFSGIKDGTGALLTNSTAACKATIGAGSYADTSIANESAMTYSGTPGTWTITVPATSLPRGTMVYAQIEVYDATGTTLHLTAFAQLQAIA